MTSRMNFQLGEVFAERTLVLNEGAGNRTVTVRIGQPIPDGESQYGDWQCPFEVRGLGTDTVFAAFGVDSMQALIHALEMIRIQMAGYQAEFTLTWLENSDLGFKGLLTEDA